MHRILQVRADGKPASRALKKENTMNPLYSEFKRKFSLSMYKNLKIKLGEMSFFKDYVHDTRGNP